MPQQVPLSAATDSYSNKDFLCVKTLISTLLNASFITLISIPPTYCIVYGSQLIACPSLNLFPLIITHIGQTLSLRWIFYDAQLKLTVEKSVLAQESFLKTLAYLTSGEISLCVPLLFGDI